jgi:hypothetical protein
MAVALASYMGADAMLERAARGRVPLAAVKASADLWQEDSMHAREFASLH